MTLREKIAHLYRRYGLGATPAELDEGCRIGLEAAIKKLVDYDSLDEGFNVSPYEFVWRMDKSGQPSDVDLSSGRYRAWRSRREASSSMAIRPRDLEDDRRCPKGSSRRSR